LRETVRSDPWKVIPKFVVWEFRRGGRWKNRRMKWKKIRRVLGGESFRVITFFHNSEFSQFEGTKKLYRRKVLKDLDPRLSPCSRFSM